MEKRDLYDMHQMKLNKTKYRNEPLLPGEYFLAVHLCLFNHQGDMLIQKRQPSKKNWPGLWDLTAGGAVVAGDSSQQSMGRELYEELGLKRDFTALRPFITIPFEKGFTDYYFLKEELDISCLALQQEEVEKVIWASEAHILALIDKKQFVPYQKNFIQLLFAMSKANTFPLPPGVLGTY